MGSTGIAASAERAVITQGRDGGMIEVEIASADFVCDTARTG